MRIAGLRAQVGYRRPRHRSGPSNVVVPACDWLVHETQGPQETGSGWGVDGGMAVKPQSTRDGAFGPRQPIHPVRLSEFPAGKWLGRENPSAWKPLRRCGCRGLLPTIEARASSPSCSRNSGESAVRGSIIQRCRITLSGGLGSITSYRR
jgi:hypothetical protein